MTDDVLRFAATWIMVALAAWFLSKMSWGRPLVYGLLWMAVALLLVSHSEEISSLVSQRALQLNG